MNIFLWVLLDVLLVFCVIPMLFMGKRDRAKPDDTRNDEGSGGSAEL